ncbi:hypothetical protein DENIT_130103 [Pseudomonas veronii]|nr:hypothetical protein DENIT_130103 [Pseudomonas veronii]
MTGTPILVNTAKWPVISPVALIYLASKQFKQTFVLDAESGVDIMRHLERKVVIRLPSERSDDAYDTQPPPIRKKACEPE